MEHLEEVKVIEDWNHKALENTIKLGQELSKLIELVNDVAIENVILREIVLDTRAMLTNEEESISHEEMIVRIDELLNI